MVDRKKIMASKKPSRELLTRLHGLKGERGRIAAIEPDSGDYFLGDTLTEVLQEARREYPDKIFYSIRIGYDYVHELKAGLQESCVEASGT